MNETLFKSELIYSQTLLLPKASNNALNNIINMHHYHAVPFTCIRNQYNIIDLTG